MFKVTHNLAKKKSIVHAISQKEKKWRPRGDAGDLHVCARGTLRVKITNNICSQNMFS